MSSVKLFSTSTSYYLAEGIAREYGAELGDVHLQRFSDGEISPIYKSSVRGCDVFIIGSTNPPSDNLVELLLMIDAAKRASAKQVSVVIPYYGYARQDRKDQPRVSIAAKVVANLLSAAGADRVITCDLHAGQIQGFFDYPVDHLYGSYVFAKYLKNLAKRGKLDLIIASPDVGGTKRARSFAKRLRVGMVICDKRRDQPNQIASMQVIGDVEGKDVVLVDDLVDTGGTLATAAGVLKEKGAKSVRAICTHAILSGKAFETIGDSELEKLVVTNTLPLKKVIDKIEVLDVAPMFAKGIRKITQNESISSLFI